MLKKPGPMSKKLETSQKKTLGQTPPQSKKLKIALTLSSKTLGLHQNVLDKSIPHPRSPCSKRRNHLDRMTIKTRTSLKRPIKPIPSLKTLPKSHEIL
jgi:hypothetical protein